MCLARFPPWAQTRVCSRKGLSMKTGDQKIIHIEAGEGRSLRVFGEVVTLKVASRQTGGAYSLSEAVVGPTGGSPPHIHHREDECFYILEGTFAFTIEDHAIRASPGSLLYIPKGVMHTYESIIETPGRMLVWQTPGGLCERLYEEVGEEVTSHALPPTEVVSLKAAGNAMTIAQYGTELVLPEPLEEIPL